MLGSADEEVAVSTIDSRTAGLDEDASAPTYRRLAAMLRGRILAGRYAESQPLPTDLELSRDYGLSRQTVRRAYLDLVVEGLVYRARGRGTFVVPPSVRYRRGFACVQDVLALSTDSELEVLEPLARTIDAHAAERLDADPEDLWAVTFRRSHRGHVFCLTLVHLPGPLARALGRNALHRVGARSQQTVIGMLEDVGIRIVAADQVISARTADDVTAAKLGYPAHAPLLHVERLYTDERGQPVERALCDYRPDRYAYRLHLHRHHPSAPVAGPCPQKGTIP